MIRFPTDQITVVPSESQYAEQMAAHMALVYGGKPDADPAELAFDYVFTPEHFRQHIAVFPEGQFTAFHGDKIVGVTVSMRIHFDPQHPKIEPWWVTVGEGFLPHVSDGEWLYGVESDVNPQYQGQGVGGKLIEARFDTARWLNLRGMVAGSTLKDYGQHAHEATPDEYVRGVVEGNYFDGNLSKQIIKGFHPVFGASIPDYVDEESSLGWGNLIVWQNPNYDPATGTRAALPEDKRNRVYTRAIRK